MKTKKAIKYFSIMQYKSEEDYLRSMNQSGWKLVKVSGFCVYHFEECEPADMIYRLDYNQEGIRHKEEYVQMFNDCGWEYLQDYVGYSYFRKPAGSKNSNDDIFCDDESRLQMMSRVLKGRMLPLLIIFFGVIIPQLIMQIMNQNFALTFLFGAVLVLYIVIFVSFAVEYLKYKNNVKK